MAAVTALTAQNTTCVTRVFPIPPDMVAAQIDAIFSDIAVHAVKIGMLAEPAIAEAGAASLRKAAVQAKPTIGGNSGKFDLIRPSMKPRPCRPICAAPISSAPRCATPI